MLRGFTSDFYFFFSLFQVVLPYQPLPSYSPMGKVSLLSVILQGRLGWAGL